MLTIQQLRDRRDGSPLRGFFVRNKRGKVMALGCGPKEGGHKPASFVVMHAKRYAHDLDLCRAVRKLTGCAPRGVKLD